MNVPAREESSSPRPVQEGTKDKIYPFCPLFNSWGRLLHKASRAMKHRLGMTAGVVLLGIGVAPFWMGKSTATSHPALETAALKVSGTNPVLVASGDDYIPPLLGFFDDDLVDNPRLNPMLALTGGLTDDDEPARLTFLADYVPRMPAAPGLLLVGGYDVPRLAPFPNPGSSGLNLFGANQLDPTGGPSLDNPNRAMAQGPRPELRYASSPGSINPNAPLNYPRPTPGVAQPMPNPPNGAPGAPTQNPAGGVAGMPPGGYAPQAPGYAPGQAGYPAPGMAGPPPVAGGSPEMLAYAGADANNPARPGVGYPQAGYPQAAPGYPGAGYPAAGFVPQTGYGFQPGCTNCGYGQNFGGGQYPAHAGNFGGVPQYAAGFGGYQGGFGCCPQNFGCQPSFDCCPPSFGCCMPTSCCGPEMGCFSGGCCPPAECCYSGGCCPPKRGLFCRLKDWFKGGSRCCNDYDSYCCEQPRSGLFSRCKNWFRRKKDPCCYPVPMYCASSCNSCCNYGGFEGGFGGCCSQGGFE
jgi:hypothetical protein